MEAKQRIDASQAGTLTIGEDLTVNRMGFGAMRITGAGIWGPPKDKDEAIRVLRRTVELGINFIDTADSYGPHVSEELIAEALYPYPEGLVIGTKGGLLRTGPNQWPVDGHPDHLREALEGSLKRLKLERIDLYQLHRFDPKVPIEDTLGFLKEAQDKGQIRHIGLSEVSVEQIKQAQQYVDVVSVQNMYSFGNRKWQSVVEFCEANDMAFIPWYPLNAGDLEGQKRLHQLAEKHGSTEYQIALAWLLKSSPAMLVIPGTSKVKHLEDNTAAAALQLSDEDMQALEG
jgi:aryl-alcohol dehydrogenase-like predicted oxidoreductase